MISCSKGTWNFLPLDNREEIVAVFERQNPAIEQFLGADNLPAEVVDEEHAAVGLEVDRGLIELGLGVVAEVEHFERQFAAGHDHRADDATPSADRPRRWSASALPWHPVIQHDLRSVIVDLMQRRDRRR